MRDHSNLDLLRSFAVTLVVWDHTAGTFGYPVPGGGLFGVYLFFVHTALVLMWSLERQPFILPFYIRRIFRIYPLAIVAILSALIFHLPVSLGGPWYTYRTFSPSTILANLLLIQDLARRPNIVGVFWTLAIEVQMYLVLPVLFFFVIRERRLWQPLVLWLLTVVVVKSYVSVDYGNTILTVAPNFLAGVIAFIAFKKFRPVLPAWLFFPWLFALLLVFIHHHTLHAPWPITLVLGLTLPLFRPLRARLVALTVNRIALYSYGIYIWHEVGMKLADHFLHPFARPLQITAELLFTGAAAVLGYHLVEAPAMRLGAHLQQFAHPRMRPPVPELEPVP